MPESSVGTLLDRAAPRRLRAVRRSSGPTSSAARRSCACACRARTAPTASLLPLRARRRAARRRGDGRRGDRHRRLVAGDVPGREPGHALPLAAHGRRRRLRLGERPRPRRRTRWPTPTTSSITAGHAAARLAPRARSPTRSSPTASRRRGLDVATPPTGRSAARWDELPTGRGRPTPRELYGGDLRGVEQHLDHIESLGANLIYLTPFFPASSTHRYDATTFDARRPAARRRRRARSLARAAHARGIRADRRHHAEPHRRHGTSGSSARTRTRRARARLLLLRRRDSRTATSRGSASARCRSSTGGATELHDALRATSLRRYLDARPRRLAHRRREHGRPLPRRST